MDLSERRQSNSSSGFLANLSLNPSLVMALIILTALMAFEIFNYSTTDFALRDLLGNLTFAGVRWSTILSIAFCGIDFAGIARLFTPDQGSEEPKEVWYLFGAWLIAATMNAILTWWGISMAIVSHSVQSTAVIEASTLTKIVPIFVALMVWVIRILIIGSLSMASDRMLRAGIRPSRSSQRGSGESTYERRSASPAVNAAPRPASSNARSASRPAPAPLPRPTASVPRPAAPAPRPAAPAPRPATPAPRPTAPEPRRAYDPFDDFPPDPIRPEPSYHSLTAAPRRDNNNRPPSDSNGNERFR